MDYSEIKRIKFIVMKIGYDGKNSYLTYYGGSAGSSFGDIVNNAHKFDTEINAWLSISEFFGHGTFTVIPIVKID